MLLSGLSMMPRQNLKVGLAQQFAIEVASQGLRIAAVCSPVLRRHTAGQREPGSMLPGVSSVEFSKFHTFCAAGRIETQRG